jgi:hypothetical protein
MIIFIHKTNVLARQPTNCQVRDEAAGRNTANAIMCCLVGASAYLTVAEIAGPIVKKLGEARAPMPLLPSQIGHEITWH